MKRHVSLLTLAVFLGGLISLVIFMQAQAQIDAFTFFIPYETDVLADQFDIGNTANVPAGKNMDTTISIAVQRDNTVIYYDHWEGSGTDAGLEANLTAPIQPSTQIWGDGNAGNGSAPGIPGDILNAGDVIVLQNIVPVPRNPANFYYDGGDKLTAVGGSVAVVLAVWPETPPGILYAGAWELYPTSRWGTEYVAPVGEDLAGQRPGFQVVGLSVQAALDNTPIEIDLDGNGTVDQTVTLNQGQSFALTQGVTTGTIVRSTNGQPIQVHLFTANPAENYEARAYTLIPVTQWTTDYLAPRSSDGDYWLYNPNNTTLVVTVQMSMTMATLNIPPKTTVPFSNNGAPMGMNNATGIHFTSTAPFYGIAALDDLYRQDWGYALLPVANLSTQDLVGWGPGNEKPIPDGDQSRVYVTALTTTTLTVRYSDGSTTNVLVGPLQEVPITATNHIMTGAFLYTIDKTPFVSVWGQDAGADIAAPSIDVGTGIVPLPALAIQKSVALITDADGTGTITWGDIVEFKITAYNNTAVDIFDGTIEDNLPVNLTYIPGTSTVNGVSIPDGGATPFPFDEGGYNVGVIPNESSVDVTFLTSVNENVDSLANGALASSSGVTPSDPGGITIPLRVPRYEFDKRLISPADGQSGAGQSVTFGLTITSTGNISLTKVPLQDTFNENHLTFLNANPPPDTTGPGIINWNDLTTVFGPLFPNQTIFISVTYTVDPIPNTVTNTVNVATVNGAEGSDGTVLPPLTDTAQVFFPPPVASFEMDKRLISPANGLTSSGQVITFGISITSTGNISITKLPLRDTFNEDHLTFLSATPAPDSNGPGITNWNDLTTFFGPLFPGQSISIIVSYTVDQIPSNVASTMNVATVEGAEGIDGSVLPPLSDNAEVFFPTPSSPPSSGTGGGDDDPPPTPTPTLPPPPPPPATPQLPVLFLPETGLRETADTGVGIAGGVYALLTVLSVGIAIYYVRRKSKNKR